jgi:hypothetical protein
MSKTKKFKKNDLKEAIMNEEDVIVQTLSLDTDDKRRQFVMSHISAIEKLYREFVKRNGFCPVNKLTGDDWAKLFRQYLERQLKSGNPYSNDADTVRAYITTNSFIQVVEECFGVKINRKMAGMERKTYCHFCGAILVPVKQIQTYNDFEMECRHDMKLNGNIKGERTMMKCPVCGREACAYPGTNIPSSKLVGPYIRAIRIVLHENFDPMWFTPTASKMENDAKRQCAYHTLAYYAGMPVNRVHFSRIEGIKDAAAILKAVNQMRKAQGLPVKDELLEDGSLWHNGRMVKKACPDNWVPSVTERFAV